jgi:membrane associated rhomboid family serine protease
MDFPAAATMISDGWITRKAREQSHVPDWRRQLAATHAPRRNLRPRRLERAHVPARALAADPAANFITIFTAMFMHGGWLHLLGNMLFLWIFGDNVEDRLGHVKFLVFYLLAGIAATLAQFALAPHSSVPNVGASGAIAGVLGAYILMFPQSRVNVLLGRQIVAMPAVIVLGMWIVLQLVSGVGTIAYTDESANVGGVAYMAHIGGFAAGLLMAFLLRGTSPPGDGA